MCWRPLPWCCVTLQSSTSCFTRCGLVMLKRGWLGGQQAGTGLRPASAEPAMPLELAAMVLHAPAALHSLHQACIPVCAQACLFEREITYRLWLVVRGWQGVRCGEKEAFGRKGRWVKPGPSAALHIAAQGLLGLQSMLDSYRQASDDEDLILLTRLAQLACLVLMRKQDSWVLPCARC